MESVGEISQQISRSRAMNFFEAGRLGASHPLEMGAGKEERCHHAVGKASFEVTGSDIAMKGILEQRSDRRREQSNGSGHDLVGNTD